MSVKKVLVISHVLPFPGNSGQEQRVRNTLESLKKHFHVTFLTTAEPARKKETLEKLSSLCDKVVCLDSRYSKNRGTSFFHKCVGTLFSIYSSLKLSNYIIGHLEFTSNRIKRALGFAEFDVVLYEYWHTHKSVSIFQQRNIPCILDMHNILWSSFEQQQARRKYSPSWLKRFHLRRYKAAEEKAWAEFDGIVAINREEESCVRNQLVGKSQIFYAPMGIELAKWHYAWQPSVDVPRVAYYGGLASPHNQQSAMDCYTNIMPVIWQRFPNAEFWIIGSNPSSQMRNLSNFDSRVKVTGFVENVQEVLTNISVVICPWVGKYGFRSRLIEVIALGVPLVTTPDAVHGMELEDKRDVLLGINDDELATNAISLLEDKLLAHQQSRVARQTIERLYSSTSTYDKLSQDICVWLDSPRTLHKKSTGFTRTNLRA